MNILVIGGGSIGQRHAKNLRALGETDVTIVDTNPERGDFPSLDAAFAAKEFSMAFICSPTIYHLEQAMFCAEKGCDLFIEKPLSHTMEGVDTLTQLVKSSSKRDPDQTSGLITMVGSNWKFYPLFQKMKELLDAGVIGRVLSARCQFGQYLPDWHPTEDYRHGYSANKKLGGGILLDSHEFDYLTWFMNEPLETIVCVADKVSDLDIDVEDTA